MTPESSTPVSQTEKKSKPCFVYLVGASGTGKTVLANALAERLNAKVYTGAARGVIAKWPLTPQEMLSREDKSAYFDFQMSVLAAQGELEQAASLAVHDGTSVVLDRGIDHLAYLSHFHPVRFADANPSVRKCLLRFQNNLLGDPVQTLIRRGVGPGIEPFTGLAVYLPPVPEFVKKARAERPIELQPWLEDSAVYGVDAVLKGLLIPFASSGRVLSLSGRTDLQFRVDSVLSRLQALESWKEEYDLAT